MQSIAMVSGADRGLGLALTAQLVDKGWRVYAGQYMPDWPELNELAARYPDRVRLIPLDVGSEDSVRAAAQLVADTTDRVDVLINNAGVTSPANPRSIRETLDYSEMMRQYNINALGPLRVVEAFLPLVERSTLKRLCFVSSEAGSIERCRRESWFGYTMSKAALNMAVKTLFNNLRSQGYTFRLYHPGWMKSYMGGKKNNDAHLEPEEAAVPALAYFLCEGSVDPEHTVPCDEDRLVLRDYQGKDWPW